MLPLLLVSLLALLLMLGILATSTGLTGYATLTIGVSSAAYGSRSVFGSTTASTASPTGSTTFASVAAPGTLAYSYVTKTTAPTYASATRIGRNTGYKNGRYVAGNGSASGYRSGREARSRSSESL
jgi:hypothetical protein